MKTLSNSGLFLLLVLVPVLRTVAADANPGDQPEATAPQPNATDDALLRSLLGEDDALPENDPQKPAPQNDDAPSGDESQDRDETPADETPVSLDTLFDSLKTAGRNLAQGETGAATQDAQQAVIDELDRLIETAEQQRQQQQQQQQQQSQRGGNRQAPDAATNDTGSGGPLTQKPGSPRPQGDGQQTEGTAAADPAGPPLRNRDDPNAESSDRVKDEETAIEAGRNRRSVLVRDVWGHLPDRLRDQLLNADADRYLPQYDSLVRRYFESLANPAEPPTPVTPNQ